MFDDEYETDRTDWYAERGIAARPAAEQKMLEDNAQEKLGTVVDA